MSTGKILAMADKTVGNMKKPLLNRARQVENSSPEPTHTINMWDMMVSMKEKERLGINFNRSVTMSLESRWEVVNKLTVEFLKEVISLNDQLSEEANKQARQLLTLIMTRTKRLGMASRMEQMAGLLMHITFYRTVLKAKVEEMHEVTSFLFHCSELMGFSHPTQIMDRYTALKTILNEIREDYEVRVNYLTKLQDKETEFIEASSRESIVLHNQMAKLHVRLKDIRIEITALERFTEEKEQQAAETMVKLKKIKASVNHCYTSMMTYKGLECRETNLVRQMEEFGIRMAISIAAVKHVEDQQAKANGDLDNANYVRRHTRRFSRDSISAVTSVHEESVLDSELELAEKVPAEANKSGNWRPDTVNQCADVPVLVSKACVELAGLRDQHGLNDFEDRDFTVGHRVLSKTPPLVPCYGMTKAGSHLEQKRCMKPFRSTGNTVLDRQRRRRDDFPSSKSFSSGECEKMRHRKTHVLDTIHEASALGSTKALSVSAGVTPQFPLHKRSGTGDDKHNDSNRFSQAALRLPLLVLKGATMLDTTSNCKTSTLNSGASAAVEQSMRDKDFLPSIIPKSNNQSRISSASSCNRTEVSDMKSVSSLPPMSRMSDRIKNQMGNVHRFYYLSSSPERQRNTKCFGFWDDGVFVSTSDCIDISRNVTDKGNTATVRTKKVRKHSKPGLRFVPKEEAELEKCRASKTQKTHLPVPLKAAVKRLKASLECISVKDLNFLQRTVNRSERESNASKTTNESQNESFEHRLATDSTDECLQSPPLSNHTSESCLKSSTRKPSLSKSLSSGKIRSKISLPVKSLHPSLRRSRALQQQRQYKRVAPPLSSTDRVETTRLIAPKSSAQKLARKLQQTRNFKRDCLSILANVNLGSRWSEKQGETHETS
ncbi:hypothetical protein ElyMa_006137300 [Elysia marginata]|uniref:Uncharacterized protein n=1 Tax=Elysia marginata TaxID=1093978 RepID=A0AAV4GXD0_9GAST|nr:hypothetical protein ElyMa_006137300 [Elysia marginata]